jgi:3-phenylpropionate/trans-cinnamate dioxygenase ferredoxin subunit
MTAQRVCALSELVQDEARRVDGESLECWAHGSAFSLRTGKPLNLPAYEPVPVFAVTIDGDDVLVDPAVTLEAN